MRARFPAGRVCDTSPCVCSPQYLACLKTSRSQTDKLSFDVGLQEDSTGKRRPFHSLHHPPLYLFPLICLSRIISLSVSFSPSLYPSPCNVFSNECVFAASHSLRRSVGVVLIKSAVHLVVLLWRSDTWTYLHYYFFFHIVEQMSNRLHPFQKDCCRGASSCVQMIISACSRLIALLVITDTDIVGMALCQTCSLNHLGSLFMCVCVAVGEACWWTIHPASKQRSEGEKVRIGDDLILVSLSSERYLVSSLLVICPVKLCVCVLVSLM